MTWEEYYEALKKKWEEVDKNDLGAIHRYNEWKRQLRKLVEED